MDAIALAIVRQNVSTAEVTSRLLVVRWVARRLLLSATCLAVGLLDGSIASAATIEIGLTSSPDSLVSVYVISYPDSGGGVFSEFLATPDTAPQRVEGLVPGDYLVLCVDNSSAPSFSRAVVVNELSLEIVNCVMRPALSRKLEVKTSQDLQPVQGALVLPAWMDWFVKIPLEKRKSLEAALGPALAYTNTEGQARLSGPAGWSSDLLVLHDDYAPALVRKFRFETVEGGLLGVALQQGGSLELSVATGMKDGVFTIAADGYRSPGFRRLWTRRPAADDRRTIRWYGLPLGGVEILYRPGPDVSESAWTVATSSRVEPAPVVSRALLRSGGSTETRVRVRGLEGDAVAPTFWRRQHGRWSRAALSSWNSGDKTALIRCDPLSPHQLVAIADSSLGGPILAPCGSVVEMDLVGSKALGGQLSTREPSTSKQTYADVTCDVEEVSRFPIELDLSEGTWSASVPSSCPNLTVARLGHLVSGPGSGSASLVEMVATNSLEGVLRDGDGQRVTAGKVSLVAREDFDELGAYVFENGPPPRSAWVGQSDSTGWFGGSALPSGEYLVLVEKDRFASTVARAISISVDSAIDLGEVAIGGTGTVVVSIDPRVLAYVDATPSEDAELQVALSWSVADCDRFLAVTETFSLNAQGEFPIALLPPGDWEISGTITLGTVSFAVAQAELSFASGETATALLGLGEVQSFDVKVEADDSFFPGALQIAGEETSVTVEVTDKSTQARVPLPGSGTYDVVATSGTGQRILLEPVHFRAGEVTSVRVPSALIKGQVLGLDGRPSPGANVVAVQVHKSTAGERLLERTARSGREGRFVLEAVSSGTWLVSASIEHLQSPLVEVDVSGEGPEMEGIVLTLSDRLLIRVRVLDAQGDLVEGATVEAVSAPRSLSPPAFAAGVTDHSGQADLAFPPGLQGPFTVHARSGSARAVGLAQEGGVTTISFPESYGSVRFQLGDGTGRTARFLLVHQTGAVVDPSMIGESSASTLLISKLETGIWRAIAVGDFMSSDAASRLVSEGLLATHELLGVEFEVVPDGLTEVFWPRD